jgi:hypothetical protein
VSSVFLLIVRFAEYDCNELVTNDAIEYASCAAEYLELAMHPKSILSSLPSLRFCNAGEVLTQDEMLEHCRVENYM